MSLQQTRVVVDAPRRTPHRFGLFSVLDFEPTERGSTLLAWDSIGCTEPQVIQDECVLGGAGGDLSGTVDCANDGSVVGFSVIAYDDSSLGRPLREEGISDRAERKLTLYEQLAAEAQVSAAVNTDASTLGASATFAAALGEVEFDLNEEGVILLRRSAIALYPDYFTQTGSMLRTKLGTPVAACSGWDAAIGDTDVLGVAAFVARRGPVATGHGFGQNTNDRSDFAQRDYSIGWECEPIKATVS